MAETCEMQVPNCLIMKCFVSRSGCGASNYNYARGWPAAAAPSTSSARRFGSFIEPVSKLFISRADRFESETQINGCLLPASGFLKGAREINHNRYSWNRKQ